MEPVAASLFLTMLGQTIHLTFAWSPSAIDIDEVIPI